MTTVNLTCADTLSFHTEDDVLEKDLDDYLSRGWRSS